MQKRTIMDYLATLRSAFLVFGLASSPITLAQGEFDLDARAIDAVFSEWTQDRPGGAVGIFKDGETLYANAFGLSDLVTGTENTVDTKFHIASVAKTFTAFAVLLLEERNQLSLEDDIRDYLPEIPDFGETITINHLLHHTSGLRNWSPLFAMQGITEDDEIDHLQVYELLTQQRELNHPPGARETYSNSNYYLLARIIEQITGQGFPDFAQEKIFAPLEMKETFFQQNLEEPEAGLAWGHSAFDGERFNRDMPRHNVYGASKLITTLSDFALWEANLSNPVVGSSELVETLYSRGELNNGSISRFAKGTGYNHVQGLLTRGMGGSEPGYLSAHNQHPELGLTVVVLANARIDIYTPYIEIMKLCCPEEISAGESALAEFNAKFIQLEDSALEQLAGAYRVDGTDDVLFVFPSPGTGGLVITGFEFPFRLRPTGQSEFQSVSPVDQSTVEFSLDDSGTRKFQIFRDGQFFYSASRITQADSTPEYFEQFAGTYRSPELASTFELLIKDGSLYRTGEGFPDRLLTSEYIDVFVDEIYAGTHLFERDENGTVTGFRISVAGVNNLLYEKVQ